MTLMTKTHYYELMVEHIGVRYRIGAACFPVDDKGFEMKVLVRSPVPKVEMPVEVADLWEEWLADVRSDFFSKAEVAR